MFYVSFHVLRNILSAQCRIRFEDDSESTDTLKINLNNKCVNISLMSNDVPSKKFAFFAPEEFFLPTSVTELSKGTFFKVQNSEAIFINRMPTKKKNGKRVFESSFRLQITNSEILKFPESIIDEKFDAIRVLNKKFIANLNSPFSDKQISHLDVKEILRLQIKPKTQYQLHCTTCDASVGNAIFENIKEQYSESFSEGWFCHQTDALHISDRLPSDNMYLDETSFLFPDVYQLQNLCSCGSTLCVEGSQIKGFNRVYFDKVDFRNPEHPLGMNSKEYKRWISTLTLWSLMKKSRTASLFSKILLESKSNNGEEDTCLLLLVPAGTVSRFRLQSPVSRIPATTNLWIEAVYHVLYMVGTHASKEVKTWRHAFDVDFYRVSDTMMDAMTEVLHDSDEVDETLENGFSCSYMPACFLKM